MTFDELEALCLAHPLATWDTPFDETTVCFRVGGRIFALCPRNQRPLRVNLKGDPALNRDLRSSYPEIVPGWHMNKEHWNTVHLEGDLDPGLVGSLIKHSYSLVRSQRPRASSSATFPAPPAR